MSYSKTKESRPDRAPIQAVDRAIQVLLAFGKNKTEMSIRQLSRELDLPKSTVHRILNALAKYGLIEQVSATEGYRLGLTLHTLGARVLESRNLVSEAEPILRRIVDLHGETTSLSILDGFETVIVDKIESSNAMRVTSQIGKRNPIHCSASGKALLAFQNREHVDSILSRIELTAFTAKTITDPGKLRESLAMIRKLGYAVDDEEIQDDQVCISAPVCDHHGSYFASITVSGPASRIRAKDVVKIAKSVMEGAAELSRKFGWVAKECKDE